METFAHTKTGELIYVAENDIIKPMNWENANSAIVELYPRWRLPTIDELEAMYNQLHKHGKGNFKETIYWSGSEFGSDSAWYYNFALGMDGTGHKKLGANIRIVKNKNK